MNPARGMQKLIAMSIGGLLLVAADFSIGQTSPPISFFNWETAPIHPITLSPDHRTLAVCNLPDNRVELFTVNASNLVAIASVPVGLDPVSAHFISNSELWIANRISDSINIVNLDAPRVTATLQTLNAPADIALAGSPLRAFVTCSGANKVQVFDLVTHDIVATIPIEGERPKAMAVSPDGKRVYVAIFESGNRSTIIAPPMTQLEDFPTGGAVNFPSGPHGGLNPPPNSGDRFSPTANPRIPSSISPPRISLIVKKNQENRWMDDNRGDWTDFVSGAKAYFTGRVPGWDLADHDVAVIDAQNLSVTYLTGLMNICMDLAVNPISGSVAVVGTDALNEVRFEPVLKGVFLRVNLALADPQKFTKTIKDLNSHLNYATPIVPRSERLKSIGDPRGIVWNSSGTRAYVTGMGSNNLLILDQDGNRIGPPIVLGEGPTGLVLDEAQHRLFVLNRFGASISVVDTEGNVVRQTLRLFDPTPGVIKAGRKHFYDTHKSSGLGQASCASCHVDGRFDRLAWDLGDPTGKMKSITATSHNFAHLTPAITNDFHPMKGAMVTQTLQDIINHEPFHWRGDRLSIEEFNPTFTALQGAENDLTRIEMQEFKDFLATIAFPPNPFRRLDNSLSTNIPLAGHLSLGRGTLPFGATLPNGNARNGLTLFRDTGPKGCVACHALPTGLGPDRRFGGVMWNAVPVGARGEHHIAVAGLNRAAGLPFKVQHLRNLYDKVGATFLSAKSLAGFGFFHDGGVDSLTRFLQDGFDFRSDQDTADMIAFLLSVTGSDLPGGSATDENRAPGVSSLDVPAAVGKQMTLATTEPDALLRDMMALANNRTSRVELVAKGRIDGIQRGWIFIRGFNAFLSDRIEETISFDTLCSLAKAGSEITFTLAPAGSGIRIGIDRDGDDFPDRTEIDLGSDPFDATSVPGNRAPTVENVPDETIPEELPLRIQIHASDPDLPVQRLTFSLAQGAPTGSSVEIKSGEFSWTPSVNQGPGVYRIGVIVTDDGFPPLSAKVTFSVVVTDPFFAMRVVDSGSTAGIFWQSKIGRTYRVQFRDDLESLSWTTLGDEIKATTGQSSIQDMDRSSLRQRFYRVQEVE